MTTRFGRRALLAAGAGALVAPMAPDASAMGRTPASGKVAIALPWPTTSIDPHDPCDPAAALFAHAIADPLYALDASGEPAPALADAMPIERDPGCVVRLRPGLVTARGKRLDAVDVVATLARARRIGAGPLLHELPIPTLVHGDPLAVSFAGADSRRVALALASPHVALVPRSFVPERPDGTGAFRAEPAPDGLSLRRNPFAARGASFLDEIAVTRATDLAGSLRAFEGGASDVGWLGAGLHAPREGAVAFDLGAVGWIVVRTGKDAGAWSLPGVAQKLVDAVPPERVQQLGLGVLPAASGEPAWGGAPSAIAVREDAAVLVEVARVLASIWTRPGHEVTVAAVPAAVLARRRASGAYALMVDIVRPMGGPGLATLLALASADHPRAAAELARRPPKLASFAPRSLTRGLRLGVLGELRISGASAPDVVLARGVPDGWDLGASFRRRRLGPG